MATKVVKKQTFKNVKFIHCRSVNDDNSIKPNGGLTIAYVVNAAFKVVGWAAARCNPLDTYNKQIGRMKASGRLLSDKWYQECPELDEPTFIQQSIDGYKKNFEAV